MPHRHGTRPSKVCQDPARAEHGLAYALERLKGAGLKVTQPRQALLRSIAKFASPFTTEDAFKALRRRLRGQKVDLVTVYRSLSTFAELDIIGRVEFGDGIVRYELMDPSGHHHHFICESCRKVEPLTLCEVGIQENHLRAAGYTRLSHRMEFFGLCPRCTK